MAAIAKFVSYDGGIAFSEKALKIQHAGDKQGKVIPIINVISVAVRRPTEEYEGFIHIRIAGDSRGDCIYFDDDQYAEAVQFKRAFESITQITIQAMPSYQQKRESAAGKKDAKKKAKWKRIVLGITAFYVLLMVMGGITMLFGKGGKTEVESPATMTEETNAAEEFLSLVRDATMEKTIREGESITDIALNGRDLHVMIDISGSSIWNYATEETIDDFLMTDSDSTSEAILEIGDQYDTLWDTITVDFGEYGKVVNDKANIGTLDMSEYGGLGEARYFPPETQRIEHYQAASDKISQRQSESGVVQNTAAPGENSWPLDSLCAAIESVLAQNYDHYSIEHDDSSITIGVWHDGIALELAAIQTSGGDENNADWAALKDGLVSVAKSIRGVIDTAGREDVYLVLNLLNDQNTEKTLLSIFDTTVFYDVLTDN